MSRTRLSTYTAPPAEVTRTLDALRAHYEVPTVFPPEALAEAEAAAGAWAQDGPARLLADAPATPATWTWSPSTRPGSTGPRPGGSPGAPARAGRPC